MTAISRLIHSFGANAGRDAEFEQYYGSLILNRRNGGPSAAEARRDYASVRKHLDRAFIGF